MENNTTDPVLERKRPAAVTLLVFLFILQMPVLFISLALVLWEIGILGSTNMWKEISRLMGSWNGELGLLKAAWFMLLLLTISLVTYALFQMRPWAWTAAMLVLGGRLALGIWDFMDRKPHFFIIGLYLIPIILLNLENVRAAFDEWLEINPDRIITYE